MSTDTFDVAIIGGGPAGLSAALVLGRARRRVVVIDDGTPRNAPAEHMQGFLSRDGTPPGELLSAGRDEVRRYGVQLVDDRVVEARAGFHLQLASGRTVTARRVLLSTGAVDQLPDVAGARQRWGRDFLHCPYCHGWEVRDRAIGVLGSVEHAHLLRQWSEDVVLFTHTSSVTVEEAATLAARGIGVVDGRVERLVVTDDELTAIQLDDGRAIPRDVLFMRPSLRARPDGVAAGLGCEHRDGLLQTDAEGRTNVPGVWAAGNAGNPRAQVITAAGEGSAVAIAINNELVQEDVSTTATATVA